MAGNQGPVEPSSASSEGLFPIVDVTGWLESGDEPMGSAVKRWLEPPGGSAFADTASAWLFKEVRAKRVHGQWRVFGEDWSEKVVAELAWSASRLPGWNWPLKRTHGES